MQRQNRKEMIEKMLCCSINSYVKVIWSQTLLDDVLWDSSQAEGFPSLFWGLNYFQPSVHIECTVLYRSMLSSGAEISVCAGGFWISLHPLTLSSHPVCFSDLHIPSAVRPRTSMLLHSDIKASRGVIPICFKGTINLPISRPDRREALLDCWTMKDIMWRAQILVKRHVELMMGGIGACRRLSWAPRGRAPSMPSESDVIRRMITAMGTLMIEWPTLPPSAPPIFHLHPQHTKQLLMMRIIRRAGAVFNSQL